MAKTQIFEDLTAFLAREDKIINGVTADFAKEHGIDLEKDDGNVGCWNCVRCYRCLNCWICERCEACWRCRRCVRCRRCEICRRCVRCLNCWICERCCGRRGLKGIRNNKPTLNEEQ